MKKYNKMITLDGNKISINPEVEVYSLPENIVQEIDDAISRGAKIGTFNYKGISHSWYAIGEGEIDATIIGTFTCKGTNSWSINSEEEIDDAMGEEDTKLSKYIVLNDDKTEVRFFAIGIVNEDNTFTGMLHDYVGGGVHQELLVYRDKYMPEKNDGGELEWDEQIELFDNFSPIQVSQIEEEMDKYMYFGTNELNYVPIKDTLDKYDGKVLIDNMSLMVPYGVGNTTFPDGYEIDEYWTVSELALLKRIENFKSNLEKADAMVVDNSPLLTYWEVQLASDYDLISASWNEDDQEWEYGLNEEDIEDILFLDDGSYLVTANGASSKISLYSMTVLGGK